MKKICVCEYCIQAIRSHGDKLLVGEQTETTEVCEWCGEEADEIFEAEWR